MQQHQDDKQQRSVTASHSSSLYLGLAVTIIGELLFLVQVQADSLVQLLACNISGLRDSYKAAKGPGLGVVT